MKKPNFNPGATIAKLPKDIRNGMKGTDPTGHEIFTNGSEKSMNKNMLKPKEGSLFDLTMDQIIQDNNINIDSDYICTSLKTASVLSTAQAFTNRVTHGVPISVIAPAVLAGIAAKQRAENNGDDPTWATLKGAIVGGGIGVAAHHLKNWWDYSKAPAVGEKLYGEFQKNFGDLHSLYQHDIHSPEFAHAAVENHLYNLKHSPDAGIMDKFNANVIDALSNFRPANQSKAEYVAKYLHNREGYASPDQFIEHKKYIADQNREVYNTQAKINNVLDSMASKGVNPATFSGHFARIVPDEYTRNKILTSDNPGNHSSFAKAVRSAGGRISAIKIPFVNRNIKG